MITSMFVSPSPFPPFLTFSLAASACSSATQSRDDAASRNNLCEKLCYKEYTVVDSYIKLPDTYLGVVFGLPIQRAAAPASVSPSTELVGYSSRSCSITFCRPVS